MTNHPETEIQFIRRIMAMLLSLAGIAERAANRSYPVRAFLLWVLRRAEKAAQDFVGVEDLLAGLPRGNGPTDAFDLADSFRELAEFLNEDLVQDRIFESWWGGTDSQAASVAEAAGRGFSLADGFARMTQCLASLVGSSKCLSYGADFTRAPPLDSS